MVEFGEAVRAMQQAAGPVMRGGADAVGMARAAALGALGKVRTFGMRTSSDGISLRDHMQAARRKREVKEAWEYASDLPYRPGSPAALAVPEGDIHISTLELAQGMCAAALTRYPRMRDMVEGAKPWSTGYRRAMAAMTRQDHPGQGTSCAQAGLDYVGAAFRLGNGTLLRDVSFDDVEVDVNAYNEASLKIDGGLPKPEEFFLRMGGEELRGDELLDAFASINSEGLCQDRALDAIGDLVAHPEWLESVRDKVFVILGAGGSVSPARQLVQWGANVVAVDSLEIPGMAMLMETSVRSAGTLTVAPRECRDVLANPVGVAQWIASFDKRVVLVDTVNRYGPDYLYAAAAMELIERLVCEARPDTALVWYGAPFDAYMLTPDFLRREHVGPGVIDDIVDRYARLVRRPASRVGGVFNGLTDYRGAIFAGVKRIARWRATIEWAAGRTISYNVMPYTPYSADEERKARLLETSMRKLGYSASTSENTSSYAAAMLLWDLNNQDKVHADEYFMVSKAIDGAVFSFPFEPGTMILPMRLASMID